MVSELGAGSPNHVPVHGGEYLSEDGYHAGLNDMGMSVGKSLKFASDKAVNKIKI